ncbi:sublancin family glycopeptide [Paenibacillus amylolyticus]|uniref:sublancin family glycopeptide n=1 Tax=Paenibacillus TaxID=44249 RepID=UPI0025A31027|nr:sublancin family glycopeptide [Paenibacillus sp. PK1-4R]WJM07154.1 sublancin family glycopeptide [Paenibacillus sp. PK1-4R]
MKELMRELNMEELDLFEGGNGAAVGGVVGNGSGNGNGNGIGAAQCAYFWTLCVTAASENLGSHGGCGSTAANCKYYHDFC